MKGDHYKDCNAKTFVIFGFLSNYMRVHTHFNAIDQLQRAPLLIVCVGLLWIVSPF